MKKQTSKIPSFIAGDLTRLREVLHPKNDPVDLSYSLAEARVAPGEASLAHSLRQSEVYYILSGSGVLYCGEDEFSAEAGDCIYVAPNKRQYIENTGTEELIFLCIVSPPWSEKGEEIQ